MSQVKPDFAKVKLDKVVKEDVEVLMYQKYRSK
jgi:hypothetical protein